MTLGDCLITQVKFCHLLRNTVVYLYSYTCTERSIRARRWCKRKKNERANCLSSYIYENVDNMHSGNSFSSGLFKMPCEQVSILLYLLSVMDYDMPGDWLGYFDRASSRSLGHREGFGSTMEMNGFSVRISECSPGWYKDVLTGLPSRHGPPTDHPLKPSSSSSLFVVRGETLKLSSMSTRWFRFRLFAGITLSSLQTESQS